MAFAPQFRGMNTPNGTRADTMMGFTAFTADAPAQPPNPSFESNVYITAPMPPTERLYTTPEVTKPTTTNETQQIATDSSDTIESQLKKRTIVLVAIGSAAVATAIALGVQQFIDSEQHDATPFIANGQTPVIKEGETPTTTTVAIPPFLRVASDGCTKVIKATVAPFAYTSEGAANVGDTTVDAQPYSVNGKKGTFEINTCGLKQLPISDTQTELNGSPVAQIDTSDLLAVVKPASDNKAPNVSPLTTLSNLTENGYGEQKAVCTFLDSISGCAEPVTMPTELVQRETTVYTALAARLVLEKCGPEAFAQSMNAIATAAQTPVFDAITLTTAGMNGSDYVNKGTAAIADASVVSIDELDTKNPSVQPDITCKVTTN